MQPSDASSTLVPVRPLLHLTLLALLAVPAGAAPFATSANAAPFAGPANAMGPIRPRVPMAREQVRAHSERPHQLLVKFHDAALVRARTDGEAVSRSGLPLDALRTLAQQEGLRFRHAITLPEDALAALEQRAAARSGEAQPDLAGLLEVLTPAHDLGALQRVGRALAELDCVEFVELLETEVEPPADIAPTTPDLTSMQLYPTADPGLNAAAAWSLGFRGQGIRFSDCEYGWNLTHEDLVEAGIHAEPGQTVHPDVYTLNYDEHGTAAVGVVVSGANPYGCTGLAPDCDPYVFTEWSAEEGKRRLTCVTNAILLSDPGDVVLLEMQTTGPGGGYGPAEISQSLWMITKTGTAAGVVVVGAAGNGGQDLDSPAYAEYKARGDSGAILVGAGSADTQHAPLSFSSFGARVDVQAWGAAVATLGYGSFATYGGDENQKYTAAFNGTSSAAALVAGACVLVQDAAESITGSRLSPAAMRALLKSTGSPQKPGPKNIGPHPDVGAAIATFQGGGPSAGWQDLGFSLASMVGEPQMSGTGQLAPGQPWSLAVDGMLPHAPCLLAVGSNTLYAPFFAGKMVPAPSLLFPLFTNGAGKLNIAGVTPPGMPSGSKMIFQVWVADPTAPAGLAASNGLQVTMP